MPLISDHSGSKPRNKLRKLSKPRPGSVISTVSPRGSTDTPRLSTDGHGSRISPSTTQQQLQPQPQQQQQQKQQPQSQPQPQEQHQQALLHPPPDLSSPKWEDYVTNSSFPRPMEKSPRLGCDRSRSPCKAIPELAHLTTTTNTTNNDGVSPLSPSASPSRSAEELLHSPRKSSSSTSSSASRLSLRTYAKTPVFRVGQLEEGDTERRGPPPLLPLSSSPSPSETGVEVMAEQYRALLAPPPQTYEQFSSDLVREWEERQTEEEMETRQNSIETIRSAITRRSPLPRVASKQITTTTTTMTASSGAGTGGAGTSSGIEGAEADTKSSPASDTTLVDFEEDAIYFKPAFTPEALSPIPEDQPLSGSTSNSNRSSFYGIPDHVHNVLGMQMSVDLLTRELTCMMGRGGGVQALCDGIGKNESEEGRGDSGRSSLLQIWVMIEAYERLRSQVREMEMAEQQREALEDMFGTWLEALHRVGHDMAMTRASQRGYKVGGDGDGDGRVDMMQGLRIV